MIIVYLINKINDNRDIKKAYNLKYSVLIAFPFANNKYISEAFVNKDNVIELARLF